MSRFSTFSTCIGLLVLAAFLAGCEKDTPANIELVPSGTPDAFLLDFAAAFSARDTSDCGELLHGQFRYILHWSDIDDYPRAADQMNRAEQMRTLDGLFSNQNVINFNDAMAPVYTRLDLELDRTTDWIRLPADGADFPRAFHARCDLTLDTTNQAAIQSVYGGEIDIYLAAIDSSDVDGETRYDLQMIGLRDLAAAEDNDGTLGTLELLFLTNQAPVGQIDVSEDVGTTSTLFSFDASGTTDPDGDDSLMEYCWRFDDDGAWTAWDTDPTTTHIFGQPGNYTLTLGVRDAWNQVATGIFVPITVNADPPATPNELMSRFAEAMVQMDAPASVGLLTEGYAFHRDIPGSQMGDWYYVDEVVYLGNLFLGTAFTNSEGVIVAPVNGITLSLDGSAEGWIASDDARFPGAMMRTYSVVFDVSQPGLTLQVRNDSRFFVMELDDGQGGSTWKLDGQVELPTAKAVESATWGDVRSLYR